MKVSTAGKGWGGGIRIEWRDCGKLGWTSRQAR